MGYEQVDILKIQPPASGPIEPMQIGMGGGVRYDVPQRALEFDEATLAEDVRFDSGDLVKEGGWNQKVGATAVLLGSMIGLGEYFDAASMARVPIRVLAVGPILSNYGIALETGSSYGGSINGAGADVTDLVDASFISMYGSFIVTIGGRPQIWDGVAASMSYLSDIVGFTARHLAPFGTRILAMYTDGDPQKIRWNKSGDMTNTAWTGVGSGITIAADVRSDSVDAIKGGVQIADNLFAMFRQRSIWRCFNTGNATTAIGCLPWIPGIGTNCPNSIVNIGRHAAFFANNLMPTLLGGSGELIPIGLPIHKELRRTLSPTISSVGAGYNAHSGELWFTFPTLGITWIFDVNEYYNRNRIVWRKRITASITPYLYGPSPTTPLGGHTNGMVFGLSGTVQETGGITKNGTSYTGKWLSRQLNKDRLSTITLLQFLYTSPTATTITLKITTDGGTTFVETHTINLAATGNKQATIAVGLNSSGADLRFQIEFDQTVECRIHGYLPTIIGISGFEYA